MLSVKKPHILTESLVLLSALDVVSTMFDKSVAQQIKNIPHSNDTVLHHISEDLSEKLMDKLRGNWHALQIDKSTDLNTNAHLVAYARFIDGGSLKEEMLFCEQIETSINAYCIFYIIDKFIKENKLS